MTLSLFTCGALLCALSVLGGSAWQLCLMHSYFSIRAAACMYVECLCVFSAMGLAGGVELLARQHEQQQLLPGCSARLLRAL